MEVHLKIFEISVFGIIKINHTEIEYAGRDYGFGRLGVMATPSHIDKSEIGFNLKRVYFAGISNVDPEAFNDFVKNSVIRFNRHSYSLFLRNCRHFSEYLLTELAPNENEQG